MTESNNKINQQMDEKLFPSKGYVIGSKLVALFIFGIFIFYIIHYHNFHFDIISALINLFCIILIFLGSIQVLRENNMYINEKEKYFLIKGKKIFFDEIENFEYHYGFSNPLKYPLFGTEFCFHLKTNEKISFRIYYNGSGGYTVAKLKKLGFNVNK